MKEMGGRGERERERERERSNLNNTPLLIVIKGSYPPSAAICSVLCCLAQKPPASDPSRYKKARDIQKLPSNFSSTPLQARTVEGTYVQGTRIIPMHPLSVTVIVRFVMAKHNTGTFPVTLLIIIVC